ISKYQAHAGHRVTVLTIDDGTDVEQAEPPFEIVRLPGWRVGFGNPVLPGLFDFVRGRLDEFDLIHVHSQLFFSSVFTAWSVPKGGPPIIMTCHGVRSASIPFVLSDMYLRTIARATLRRVRRILCYSERDGRLLSALTN